MHKTSSLTKLGVSVPPDLEVCWCLLRVKRLSSPIKEMIVCAFYCPPRSRKKTKLIEHISTEYYKLKSAHPRAAFMCGGDKNDLHVKHFLDISPSFRQIITKATHKNSVLECLITDIGHLYNEPVIGPPIKPDLLLLNPSRSLNAGSRVNLGSLSLNARMPASWLRNSAN